MADVASYVAKITSEHNQRPKFVATVALSAQPFVDGINLLLTFPTKYDVDVSVGTQEDADGLWIGISRYIPVPLVDVYFSWDTPGLGWTQGVWKGPFDPSEGLVRLDDEVYRLVLKTKIAANNWKGTVVDAAAVLANIFNDTITPGTLIVIDDHMNMSMTVAVSGVLPPTVYLELLAEGFFPLKPMGVFTNYVATSVSGAPVFGWGVDNDFVGGWSHGTWPIPAADHTPVIPIPLPHTPTALMASGITDDSITLSWIP